MNTPFYIARRYFLSKKKKNFINVISIISMAGVAFPTMALVIALSVFNGLEDLIRSLYSSFDPEIKISPARGKSFEIDSAFLQKIQSVEGVDLITEVIEDWAHLQHKGDEKLVKVKGVSENFVRHGRMDSAIVEGDLILEKDNRKFAIVGRGIQSQLMISLYDELGYLVLSYPDSSSRKGLISPTKISKVQKVIKPGGIFAIEKQYDDNYVFVPLSFARDLMQYGNKRTSLEIKTTADASTDKVRDGLKDLLGKGFLVQNSDEQHSSLLKAIKIEKLFVYIVFSFILAIASLNIFFSLTMLAIEKKKDVAVLFAMGASRKFIKKLFLIEGFIISVTGAVFGLALGVLICWAQQEFGIVSMGMETSVVDAYPVKMEALDFVFTAITILLISFAISYRPASKASRFELKENLK